jgi:hypothetical protein
VAGADQFEAVAAVLQALNPEGSAFDIEPGSADEQHGAGAVEFGRREFGAAGDFLAAGMESVFFLAQLEERSFQFAGMQAGEAVGR